MKFEMMTRMLRWSLAIVLGVGPMLMTATALAQEKARPHAPAGTVAILAGKPISDAELEEVGKDKLARIKAEELNLKRQILEEYIVKRLLEDQAKLRGLTVIALEKAEIDDKILPVTEEQKRAVYEMVPQNFTGKSEADAFKQIEVQLRSVRLAEARKKVLADLRRRAGVEILLPEPVRATVAVGDDPVSGPSTAPVTLVAYTDFQCPFCVRAYATVKQLRAKYKDQLRVVFKDFPLDIHPQATKAAEGGSCAFEQGKFWEYHDRLFENPRALSIPDLKKVAQGLGLDLSKFNECIDSNKYTAEWQADMAEGQKLGASGTPTFFANGRMFVGAKSLEEMSKIIDEELMKAGGTR
jgi:protein-disulfide isomerase